MPAAPGYCVEELTRNLARGNEKAFTEFHERYFDRLFGFLLVVARGNEDEAREVIQETFIRVLRHARVFCDEEIFWCWLKRVARSAAQDRGRKHSRYLNLLESFQLRIDTVSKETIAEEIIFHTLIRECLN